jgi:hypothetical protein
MTIEILIVITLPIRVCATIIIRRGMMTAIVIRTLIPGTGTKRNVTLKGLNKRIRPAANGRTSMSRLQGTILRRPEAMTLQPGVTHLHRENTRLLTRAAGRITRIIPDRTITVIATISRINRIKKSLKAVGARVIAPYFFVDS